MQHNLPFDPAYGYSREQLLKVGFPAEPADFDEFWQRTRARVAAQALDLRITDGVSASALHRVRVLRYRTLDGVDVGGWLVEPIGRPVRMLAVIGHGYGSREAPDYGRRDAALFFPCMPGFSLSRIPGLEPEVGKHVLHGIAQRDTYIHRHCVASFWGAARVMTELFPGLVDRLVYLGDSFGGGLGALMLPWEPLYKRAYLGVPTFGNYPLRMQCRCTGSGEFVRLHVQKHPDVLEVLRYFDAASAARRIKIPVFTSPAVFDPAVPPPSQFAVCNALAGEHQQFIRKAGHFAYPEEAAEMAEIGRRLESFLWKEAPEWAAEQGV
jgi:cephalosporin-C deacetylase